MEDENVMGRSMLVEEDAMREEGPNEGRGSLAFRWNQVRARGRCGRVASCRDMRAQWEVARRTPASAG